MSKCIVCKSTESLGVVQMLDGIKRDVCFDCYTTGRLKEYEQADRQASDVRQANDSLSPISPSLPSARGKGSNL